MENKKGWSWIGFLFAPHYYAGYGQLKKGLLLAVISGIMPLTAITVGIYGGLKARKELPIKEVEFNWKNVAFTVITFLMVNLISQTVISGMKENSSVSTENSEEVSGNGQPMQLTEENLKAYAAKVTEAIKDKYDLEDGEAVSTQTMSMEDMKKVFREPLEDMGYDYDATILAEIKEDFKSGKEYTNHFHAPYSGSELEEAVNVGMISSETSKKLELYSKYRRSTDLKETVKLCEVIIECDKNGNGVCYAEKLKESLKANFPNIFNKGDGENYEDVFKLYDSSSVTSDKTTALFLSNNGYSDDPGVGGTFSSSGEPQKIILNRKVYDELKNDIKLVWWQ